MKERAAPRRWVVIEAVSKRYADEEWCHLVWTRPSPSSLGEIVLRDSTETRSSSSWVHIKVNKPGHGSFVGVTRSANSSSKQRNSVSMKEALDHTTFCIQSPTRNIFQWAYWTMSIKWQRMKILWNTIPVVGYTKNPDRGYNVDSIRTDRPASNIAAY